MAKEEKSKHDASVNQLAEKYYQLRVNNGSSAEKKTVFIKLYEIVMRYEKRYARNYCLDTEDVCSMIHEDLMYQFPSDDSGKGWNPEMGPFIGCFLTKLKWLCKDLQEKKIRKEGKDIPDTIFYDDGDEERDGIVDDSVRVSSNIEASVMMEKYICLLNDEVKLLMKKSPNKFCYSMRFYTEWLARQILEPQIENILSLIPSSADDCVDLNFASSFLNDAVGSIPEIKNRELKPLSAFSGQEADAKTPCGFDLKNIVYVQYISAATGKTISDSIISNHRKDFYELRSIQAGKIGIGNHPIAES